MRLAATLISISMLAILPATAHAQNGREWEMPSAEALEAVAARIPEREWYPEGYYDIRIAAEDEFRRVEQAWVDEARAAGELETEYDTVNIGDCGGDDLGEDWEEDSRHASFVYLAADVAKFRFRLERAGYPSALIDAAVGDYERWRLAEIAVRETGRDTSEVDFATEFGIENYDPDSFALQVMMDRLNAARVGEMQGLPEVILADGCGGEGFPVIVRTVPGDGQVWVISAFAFRVCTRKVQNPWDKFACRWSEIETGSATTSLGGRYVYEVEWPDGTSSRGTREIRGEYRESGATPVTLRRRGS